MNADAEPAELRSEQRGDCRIRGRAVYLSDLQCWAPQVTVERLDGRAAAFVVPCGPECYRKRADEALAAAWAAACQWVDGGRIPWKPRPR